LLSLVDDIIGVLLTSYQERETYPSISPTRLKRNLQCLVNLVEFFM
jgi:hypothetical protein